MTATINWETKTVLRMGSGKLTIYPMKVRKSWVLAWHEGAAGRQRRELSDPVIVQQEAERLLNTFQMGDLAAARISPKDAQSVGLIPHELGQNVSVATLIDFYRQHGSKRSTAVSLRQAADACLAAAESNNCSPRHIQTLRYHFKALCAAILKALPLVTTPDLDAHLAAISNLKTRKNHRTSYVTLWEFSKKKGMLDREKPTAASMTESPKVVREGDPEIYTPKEMKTLLQASVKIKNYKLTRFLALGGFAGCRSAEIQRLIQGEHVKTDGIYLGRNVTKTNRRRIAEITPNLAAWLALCPLEAGQPITYASATALYDALRDLCKIAKVTWKDNALRHSYVSYDVALNDNLHATSKKTGHSVSELETTYLALVSKAAAKAWSNIYP